MIIRDDAFMSLWEDLKPPGRLSFEKLESLRIDQRGPGGVARFDIVRVEAPGSVVRLLVAIRPAVQAKDVSRLKAQLLELIDALTKREIQAGTVAPQIYPAIATRAVGERLRESAIHHGVALFDLLGTIELSAGPVFAHVERSGKLQLRPKDLFRGKTLRVIRVALTWDQATFGVRELASESGVSFGLAQSVLAQLEADGYMHRKSPKSGYHLRDPAGLLRRWSEADEGTSAETRAFYAPSIQREVLRRAFDDLTRARVRCAFTLAAGLTEQERQVSALQFGLYVVGSIASVIEALELRPTTPHNFLVHVPHAEHETDRGGVFYGSRDLEIGKGVGLPQLAIDLAALGGRAREQSNLLIEQIQERVTDLPHAQ